MVNFVENHQANGQTLEQRVNIKLEFKLNLDSNKKGNKMLV